MRAVLLVLAVVGLAADPAEKPIVPEKARLEKLWGRGTFTEGPAQGPDGCIYFSDIGEKDAIMKYDPEARGSAVTVFRKPSGKANGLDFDPKGRLVACEGATKGGGRRISRMEKDGTVITLAEKWQNKRFNSPNDLTIDTQGRIYFTDPRYQGDERREIRTESVYRIDEGGKVTQIIDDVEKPNGIVLSPDMKTLYVADSPKTGTRYLLAYPLNPDGSVGKKKVLYTFTGDRGIDGMCVDEKGRIFAAAGQRSTAGINIFSPDGRKLGFIPILETPTNCVFGGKDRNLLYVTAGKSLYRIALNTRGFAVFWPQDR